MKETVDKVLVVLLAAGMFIAGLAGIISLFVLFVLIGSIPLWLLWNWLMPYLFGLPTISLLQAVGLGFLISLISNGIKITINK